MQTLGLDQALYERLLEAFGYGGNAAPMLALGRLLPWRALRDHAASTPDRQRTFEALLLGTAGLLPTQRARQDQVHPHVEALERAFAAAGLSSLDSGSWKLWGVRPANAPARRVAAAAALFRATGAPSALFECIHAETVGGSLAPLTGLRASGYWLDHHDPCAGPARLPAAFVGRSRALEILINVLLPAAAASGDHRLGERARSLFARLPRPAVYGATKSLEQGLADQGERLPINARRAQGLLALHRDWCTQGGCGRCPLS